MLRFFNLFGQSGELSALDDALRKSGLHPLLVPEAVKLTLVRLQKRQRAPANPDLAFDDAAELLAYCMLGRDTFIDNNSTLAADRADQRIEAAIAAGDSADAKLILLALHAGILAPEVATRIDADEH